MYVPSDKSVFKIKFVFYSDDKKNKKIKIKTKQRDFCLFSYMTHLNGQLKKSICVDTKL